MQYEVYILHSTKLNKFYIGYTSDFNKRLPFHLNAKSHKFTAKADDWTTFLRIPCTSKHQALNIEKHIKRMKSKTYILNLIKYPEIINKLKLNYSDC